MLSILLNYVEILLHFFATPSDLELVLNVRNIHTRPEPNKYGNTLEQYAQAVISMANFYNMRVIDVYSPASLNFAGQKSTYMADGIHPNAKAHAILADYMYRHLTIING